MSGNNRNTILLFQRASFRLCAVVSQAIGRAPDSCDPVFPRQGIIGDGIAFPSIKINISRDNLFLQSQIHF
jgi:hypothetical protein